MISFWNISLGSLLGTSILKSSQSSLQLKTNQYNTMGEMTDVATTADSDIEASCTEEVLDGVIYVPEPVLLENIGM